MVDKVIPWSVGDGNISLSYSGDKNGVITITSDENTLWEDRSMNIIISTTKGSPEKSQTIVLTQKGKTLVAGTTFNFDYTGTVQEVELPKGKYKLQCWGAQGGNSAGHSYGTGSKGGYSEGVLTLTEKTTLYVFVGGQGSRGSGSSLVNGGWNGGGASVGYASYGSNSDHYGYSYPACGGGATDIALVTSSMSYANGRTNRSSESLLSRIIVAGGGAGGSYRYTEETTSGTGEEYIDSVSGTCNYDRGTDSNIRYYFQTYFYPSDYGIVGKQVKVTKSSSAKTTLIMEYYTDNGTNNGAYGGTLIYTSSTSGTSSQTVTIPDCFRITVAVCSPTSNASASFTMYEIVTTTSTNTSSGYSNQSQQGGGTSGKGQYPGTQSAGGNGNGNDGGFGFGGNQTITNYRYVSGGAGGGWYGGGTAYSDSSTSYINYSGGGSGFVNIAANSSYRPTGYTGLQLDSGTTTAGNTSHPSTSGSTETGHSGNGYARITVIS